MARPALDPVLAERVQGVAARDRTLPLHPDLHPTLGASLQRGITVAVGGPSTATSPATAAGLSLVLAAGPSTAGSWVAAVGMPDLGLLAASEAGIELERFALVPRPGKQWGDVVASLIDGFDVVLVRPPAHLKAGLARRLVARVRERQAVLVGVGGWPEGASMRIDARVTEWAGLGAGSEGGTGHLRAIRRDLRPTGRLFRTDREVSTAGSHGVRSA
ncbi:MAG: hypothetical protein KY395_02955 [Actinobacteria bacterium]|nr:hypothetical protein [Actinomycetota bacterium]